MSRLLRILVLSDLHAHNGDPRSAKSPSHFSTDPRYSSNESNPMVGISDIVRNHCATVDWIVCPGDLGDRADATSQSKAWQTMKDITAALGATLLVGTAGNHDVDSRRIFPDFDPKGNLLELSPRFPIQSPDTQLDDRLYADRYWARNYVTVPFKDQNTLLAILNSSAFHGYASDASKPPNEHLHGRVSPTTISMLKEDIGRNNNRLNILLLHHHLRRHPFITDNSEMKNGDKLIEMLKETDRPWLVIHGHQHVPHLSYSDTHYLAPVILSSGSVAAKTWEARKKTPRNQMHLIEIDLDAMPNGELRGRIVTWTWVDFAGWRPGTEDAGLPFKCGFGSRADLRKLAKDLAAIAQARSAPVHWIEITKMVSEVLYLVPEDLESLCNLMRKENIAVQYDQFGGPSMIEARNV